MFGRGGAPVDEQIRFLEGEKAKVHIELAALQHRREQAVQAEVRAMAQIDGAHAEMNRCDRKINEQLEALSSLQAEITALIPPPRKPSA